MKTKVDGKEVFVTADDFENLQASDAVFGTCHEFCVAASVAMVREVEATRHVSFVDVEDTDAIGFKEGGKILKVTIEWVDASEANPENAG
jgi:hypothetical protein